MSDFNEISSIPYEKEENILRILNRTTRGKWKGPILWSIKNKPRRFNELLREFYPITQSTLTRQLRELEEDGLISRTVYPEVPPRVEYNLTDCGTDFIKVLAVACSWAEKYLKK